MYDIVIDERTDPAPAISFIEEPPKHDSPTLYLASPHLDLLLNPDTHTCTQTTTNCFSPYLTNYFHPTDLHNGSQRSRRRREDCGSMSAPSQLREELDSKAHLRASTQTNKTLPSRFSIQTPASTSSSAQSHPRPPSASQASPAQPGSLLPISPAGGAVPTRLPSSSLSLHYSADWRSSSQDCLGLMQEIRLSRSSIPCGARFG